MPVVQVPIECPMESGMATYAVGQDINLRDISAEFPVHAKKLFRKAMNELMLETPHTETSEILITDVDPEPSSSREVGADARDSGDRKLDLPMDCWGRAGTCEPYCLDCGSHICKGRDPDLEPVLMMLASGRLGSCRDEDWAYSEED